MILSEGEVALFARFTDEALDVFEPPGAALSAFWQAASMVAAVCLTRWQSPMMDRSASGPRRSTLACAHWPQARARPVLSTIGRRRAPERSFRRRPSAAELSGFQAEVDLHLLHAVIENAHAATVPSHPHLPADILRRRFVKGSLDLHKAVPAHVAPGLLIARKSEGSGCRWGRSSSKRAATCLQVVP